MPQQRNRRLALYGFPTSELGYLTWGWNVLNQDLCVFFCELMSPDGLYGKALAIWHSIKSDSGQREILMAVIAASDASDKIKEEMKWLSNEIGTLSALRNAAIHTAFEYSAVDQSTPPTLKPDRSWGNPRNKLVGKDLEQLFYEFGEYCYELSQFTRSLISIWGGLDDPFPVRPSRPPSLRTDLHGQSNPPRHPAKQRRQSRPPQP
jgi:hypothetical protein